jgi:hypothetical protein
MLLESKKVKVTGLGTFYLTCECQKGGADKEEDFNVNKHLKALHIRFLPDQTQEDNLSSREFIKKAEFVNIKTLLSGGDDEDGGSNANENENENGGGSSENSGSSNQGSGTITPGGNGGSSSSETQTLAAPVISGETPFAESTTVSMSGPDGAEIRYTTDGSTPTAESTLYSEAITLSDSTTVKAIAIKDGNSSQVSTKEFSKSDGNGGSGMDQN